MLTGFWTALALLTRIPVPERYTLIPATQPLWFPVIGMGVGLILGMIYAAAHLMLPVSVAVLVMMLFGLWLTGAMHEDGLADIADAMGGMTVERRREILKDSRLGSFGVLALLAYWTLKWQLLVLLFSESKIPPLFLMILLGGWSRWMPLPVLRRVPFLFSAGKGLGEELARPRITGILLQGFFLFFLTAWWCSVSSALGILIAASGIAHVLAPRFFRKMFEGINGDGCGAMAATGELLFLLVLSCGGKF